MSNTSVQSAAQPSDRWLRLARWSLIAFAIGLLIPLVLGALWFPDYVQRHSLEFTPNNFWTPQQAQAAVAELGWPGDTMAWWQFSSDIAATLIIGSFTLFLLWRKYSAAKTLAAFGVTVRDEVELDKLAAELINVVQETMQPTQVSLWLKQATDHRRQTPEVK